MAHIVVTPVDDGATVKFPKNAAVIAALKDSFPKARWHASAREWHVPGVRAQKRLEIWAAKHEPIFVAAKQARRDLEWQGIETDPGKALTNRAHEIKSSLAKIIDGSVIYGFPYLAASVQIARKMPGARWDSAERHWIFRPSTLDEVDLIISGCNEIFSLNLNYQHMKEERETARREKWAAERQARDAARQARKENDLKGSELWARDWAPDLGVPFWHYGRFVVATRIGSPFKVDTDAVLAHGSNLDVEWCVDVWLRDATEAEAAPLLAARVKAEETRVLGEMAAAVKDEDLIKSGRPIPVGYGPAMEYIKQMGIGTPYAPYSQVDFYYLSYEDAEMCAKAFPLIANEIQNYITKYKRYEEILARITQEERQKAEQFIIERDKMAIEAIQKFNEID